MKINLILIQTAMIIIIIFGGIYTLHFFKTGEHMLSQLIPASVGIILLIALIVWRVNKKKTYNNN